MHKEHEKMFAGNRASRVSPFTFARAKFECLQKIMHEVFGFGHASPEIQELIHARRNPEKKGTRTSKETHKYQQLSLRNSTNWSFAAAKDGERQRGPARELIFLVGFRANKKMGV